MKTSALLALVFGAALIRAADYPAPVENDWVVRDFRFHTGETLPELRLHYTTVGARSGEPVLILHGTNGNGRSFLRPDFAGELFGPGQPLRMPLGRGNRPSHPMDCARAFPTTTMTTWCRRSIAW
jgi:homoserine O-acetyltransferase